MAAPILLTENEEEIICKIILLPVVRKVLERDKQIINTSNIKIKDPYYKMIDRNLLKLSQELNQAKKQTFDRKMRFKRINETTYEVWVRGYHHDVHYHQIFIRSWIEDKLNEYMSN